MSNNKNCTVQIKLLSCVNTSDSIQISEKRNEIEIVVLKDER